MEMDAIVALSVLSSRSHTFTSSLCPVLRRFYLRLFFFLDLQPPYPATSAPPSSPDFDHRRGDGRYLLVLNAPWLLASFPAPSFPLCQAECLKEHVPR